MEYQHDSICLLIGYSDDGTIKEVCALSTKIKYVKKYNLKFSGNPS